MKNFTKRASQLKQSSAIDVDNGVEFVLSTPTVDRAGDRVMPTWDLSHFKNNPIALFGHNHDAIIGTWEDVRVVGTKLIGKLKLAKAGTSALVDEIRSLIEQGILKTVSIGFSSSKVKENEFGGFDLYNNSLHEVSVVAVPANQEALRKSLTGKIPNAELEKLCAVDGCKFSKGIGGNGVVNDNSGTNKNTIKIKKGVNMSRFADRIKALQKEVSEKQAQLDQLNEKVELEDAEIELMASLSNEIATASSRIKKFEEMEKSMGNVPATTKTVQTAPTFEKAQVERGVVKGIASLVKMVGGEKAPEDKVANVFAKAATDPALTSVPAWAGDLVQEGYGAYLKDLMASTVFGRVRGMRINFGRDGAINIPYRDGVQSLAGDFVAEGDPIPVKQDKFATVKIAPSKMGVITTFTKEIARKSTPAIESLLRAHMVQDTREVLDTLFLDATPADAIRPAGLEASAEAANIKAATGNTVDTIEADIQGVFERMSAARMGQGGVVIMNPARLRGLRMKTNALGQYPFRDASLLEGYEIITSINVADDKVYFIDEEALVFGLDQGIEFDVSTQATLVMADPAEPINDGTAATALPVRSLFQTDTIAIKQTLGLTWKQVRAAGVQILTGVTW